jgi:hypothetical protein
MKKAYIITSCIEVDNTKPLTYSPVRSHFSNDERFRHTAFTIASLDHIADDETTIFLVDISPNWIRYKHFLSYQSNLVFVSGHEEFPEIAELCRTQSNKSRAESMIMVAFMEKYKEQLKNYDYFIKISGRYFIDSSFNTDVFNENNINKLLFKKKLEFEFNESWGYDLVDLRAEQGNNKLYQYPSALYGFGSGYYDKMLDIYRVLTVLLDHPDRQRYDLETLLYYFTRHFSNDILEVGWRIYGFEGINGTFMRY